MIRGRLPIVFLLTGLNLLNYLDRYVIAAIGPSLQKSLALTDSEFGIVSTAFLIGYFATSPIFGRLGDVMKRTWLITFGIVVWCGATVASGLMSTFATLLVARIVVGIGEASYSSLAPTIIDDVTPPEKKSTTLAIFYAAISVGSALGFGIGGVLDKHLGWRNAFFIAGGPGILLALLCLLIAEPKRGEKKDEPHVPLRRALDAIAVRSPRYRWTTIGFVAQTFALGGFSSWAPQYLDRRFHAPADEAGLIFGGILVVTGFVGTFVGGWLADRAAKDDPTRGALFVCALSTAIAVPFGFACLLMPSPTAFYVTIAIAQLGIFMSMSPVNAVLLGTVPVETRGLAMAMSIFAGHLLGDFASVPLVGVLSERFGDLGSAMLILPAAMAVNALAWFAGVRAPRGPESLSEAPAEAAAHEAGA